MITFISTYLSHHQLPFCLKMAELTKGQFTYIAYEGIRQQRLSLGYEDLNQKYPFVLRAYENEENEKKAKLLCDTSDVLLIGSAPERYYLDRLRAEKLTIRISERPFKEPFNAKNVLHRAVGMLRRVRPYQNSNYYLFACSAFAAADYAKFGCFRNRAYRWGYFPELKEYPDPASVWEQKGNNSILWVGRLIDLKHPDFAVRLAAKLKKDGVQFNMKLIGTGEQMQDKLKTMIRDNHLSDCVCLAGAMPTEQVRQEMEKSRIFLFTSDRREGWGAVVNEAMNSCCTLIANRASGSVPFLIEDGQNGYIYPDGDFDTAYERLKSLLLQPERCRQMGLRAYDTLASQWNAANAAERMMEVISALKKQPDKPFFFESGVCSEAVRLKD